MENQNNFQTFDESLIENDLFSRILAEGNNEMDSFRRLYDELHSRYVSLQGDFRNIQFENERLSYKYNDCHCKYQILEQECAQLNLLIQEYKSDINGLSIKYQAVNSEVTKYKEHCKCFSQIESGGEKKLSKRVDSKYFSHSTQLKVKNSSSAEVKLKSEVHKLKEDLHTFEESHKTEIELLTSENNDLKAHINSQNFGNVIKELKEDLLKKEAELKSTRDILYFLLHKNGSSSVALLPEEITKKENKVGKYFQNTVIKNYSAADEKKWFTHKSPYEDRLMKMELQKDEAIRKLTLCSQIINSDGLLEKLQEHNMELKQQLRSHQISSTIARTDVLKLDTSVQTNLIRTVDVFTQTDSIESNGKPFSKEIDCSHTEPTYDSLNKMTNTSFYYKTRKKGEVSKSADIKEDNFSDVEVDWLCTEGSGDSLNRLINSSYNNINECNLLESESMKRDDKPPKMKVNSLHIEATNDSLNIPSDRSPHKNNIKCHILKTADINKYEVDDLCSKEINCSYDASTDDLLNRLSDRCHNKIINCGIHKTEDMKAGDDPVSEKLNRSYSVSTDDLLNKCSDRSPDPQQIMNFDSPRTVDMEAGADLACKETDCSYSASISDDLVNRPTNSSVDYDNAKKYELPEIADAKHDHNASSEAINYDPHHSEAIGKYDSLEMVNMEESEDDSIINIFNEMVPSLSIISDFDSYSESSLGMGSDDEDKRCDKDVVADLNLSIEESSDDDFIDQNNSVSWSIFAKPNSLENNSSINRDEESIEVAPCLSHIEYHPVLAAVEDDGTSNKVKSYIKSHSEIGLITDEFCKEVYSHMECNGTSETLPSSNQINLDHKKTLCSNVRSGSIFFEGKHQSESIHNMNSMNLLVNGDIMSSTGKDIHMENPCSSTLKLLNTYKKQDNLNVQSNISLSTIKVCSDLLETTNKSRSDVGVDITGNNHPVMENYANMDCSLNSGNGECNSEDVILSKEEDFKGFAPRNTKIAELAHDIVRKGFSLYDTCEICTVLLSQKTKRIITAQQTAPNYVDIENSSADIETQDISDTTSSVPEICNKIHDNDLHENTPNIKNSHSNIGDLGDEKPYTKSGLCVVLSEKNTATGVHPKCNGRLNVDITGDNTSSRTITKEDEAVEMKHILGNPGPTVCSSITSSRKCPRKEACFNKFIEETNSISIATPRRYTQNMRCNKIDYQACDISSAESQEISVPRIPSVVCNQPTQRDNSQIISSAKRSTTQTSLVTKPINNIKATTVDESVQIEHPVLPQKKIICEKYSVNLQNVTFQNEALQSVIGVENNPEQAVSDLKSKKTGCRKVAPIEMTISEKQITNNVENRPMSFLSGDRKINLFLPEETSVFQKQTSTSSSNEKYSVNEASVIDKVQHQEKAKINSGSNEFETRTNSSVYGSSTVDKYRHTFYKKTYVNRKPPLVINGKLEQILDGKLNLNKRKFVINSSAKSTGQEGSDNKQTRNCEESMSSRNQIEGDQVEYVHAKEHNAVHEEVPIKGIHINSGTDCKEPRNVLEVESSLRDKPSYMLNSPEIFSTNIAGYINSKSLHSNKIDESISAKLYSGTKSQWAKHKVHNHTTKLCPSSHSRIRSSLKRMNRANIGNNVKRPHIQNEVTLNMRCSTMEDGFEFDLANGAPPTDELSECIDEAGSVFTNSILTSKTELSGTHFPRPGQEINLSSCDLISKILGKDNFCNDRRRLSNPRPHVQTSTGFVYSEKNSKPTKIYVDLDAPTDSTPVRVPIDTSVCIRTKLRNFSKKKSKVLFHKLMNYSNEEKALDEVCKEFMSQDPLFVVQLVLDKVSLDIVDRPDTKYSPAPLMTETQRIMLGFMTRLEARGGDRILDNYLRLAEKRLLFNPVLEQVEPISRLYLAICKYRKDINEVRKLCCEAFYFMGDYAVPLLFTVLTSWSEVLPLFIESERYLMGKVLVQIVNLKQCSRPGYNLLALKDLIVKYYGYPVQRDSSELFKEMLLDYLKNPVRPADFQLLLFCKNHPSKLVHKLIEETLKPLLAPNIPDNFQATVIILIGNIVSQFKVEEDQKYVDDIEMWLDRIGDATSSEIIRRSINVSLQRLPQHNHVS